MLISITIIYEYANKLKSIIFFPRKNPRFQDYHDMTDSEDDGHTVSGLEPPPVIKPPHPAVVAQASTHPTAVPKSHLLPTFKKVTSR